MTTTMYSIAERFIGVREVPGAGANPQVLAFLSLDGDGRANGGDETAWCSAFANWCAWILRLPRSKSWMARSWLTVGQAVPLSEARIGFDVVILWRGSRTASTGHVGLFAGRDGVGNVYLLGGNQGGMVSVTAFPEERVLGVRRLAEDA